ncbi:MAG: laminin G, partial [Bacteroidota bacterium]|nr:laminin G [Bacteroidota bacterium]
MKQTIAQLLFLLLAFIASNAQQITIPRIEQMPDMPQPYEMRDWKAVSMAYDSLVFNLDATGLHLPLSSIVSNTTNYPAHPTFGIQSYVGTNHLPGMEAINVIPAVVGASLVGLNKSNQYGHDWVLYCEEYFNRRPAENVYLNGPTASSGHDWWYETMPNIFFYQLNGIYPHTGDFDYQFVT